MGLVAYHLHAVSVGLEAPESDVVTLVGESTDALRRDVGRLLAM
ncbi:MAG TPA: hypothetical protein VGC06_13820 [Actinomycetes bacterium]